MKKVGIGFFLFLGLGALAFETVEFIARLRRNFDLEQYDNVALDRVTVAILDRGFTGLVTTDKSGEIKIKPGVLPPTAEAVVDFSPFFGDECKGEPLLEDPHGRLMAQTAWAMTGNKPRGPKFLLLNASTLPNFKCAIRYVREIKKVDILLYSQNYEYGGDFNGTGFINEYVNSATADGILWINAAGNYGGRVYNGTVEDGKTLRLKVNNDQSTVDITLAWTGFSNDQSIGTDKDLDLEIYNDLGELLPTQNYRQVRKLTDKVIPGDERIEDLHPMEIVEVTLDKSGSSGTDKSSRLYEIRIVKKSGSFNLSDKMRVTVVSPPEKNVEFLDATVGREIMVPADNPNVVTVGGIDPLTSAGPTLSGLTKPEIALNVSSVVMSTQIDREQGGASFAAAMMAGIAAQLKAAAPRLNRQDLIRFVQSSQTPSSVRQVPSQGVPAGAQAVSLQAFQSSYAFGKEIEAWIEAAAPKTVVQPFLLADGTFLLGMTRPSPLIQGIERKLGSAADNSDIFASVALNNGTNKPFWSVRPRGEFGQNKLRHPYPWEKFQGFKKSDFVELKYVEFTAVKIPGKTVPNLWKTPTLDQLRKVVAERY
jgi:hypothetical protein